jgi:hypothetical protein
MKVETDIIASIYSSESNRTSNDICDNVCRAMIFVIMYVETFNTDIIDFIGNVITCLTSQLL